MRHRLIGVETEYAISGLAGTKLGEPRGETVNRLMSAAAGRLRHLPGMHSSGMFLENGSRFYIDCGLHPELSTPECATPSDAVRYVLAGERILLDLAREIRGAASCLTEMVITKCNVDYSGARTTWGCHESYLHRADTSALPEQILPHLVSRIIYTGAGGFDSCSGKLTFQLSPRVPHMAYEVSPSSTQDRGIFHTKNEPLAGEGHNRLHLLCGESLCSHVAAYLKLGTTALVVALIEAGQRPGDAVRLESPLEAMRAFSGDPTCRAAAASAGGQPRRALEIQRHYLEQVERHVDCDFMPAWTGEVCAVWRRILDRLEQPESLCTTLDWAIKYALYSRHLEGRGQSWESLSRIEKPIWRTAGARQRRLDHLAALQRAAAQAGPAEPGAADARPQEPPLTPEQSAMQALCAELLEIDMRFGQLGERSVFGALDRAGALSHAAPGVEDIPRAVTEPPSVGRALLRGRCVHKYSSCDSRYTCDWEGVWDLRRHRVLDLSDPLAESERWVDLRNVEENEPGPPIFTHFF